MVLAETKKKGSVSDVIDEFGHLYSGIPKDQRAKRGVFVVLRKKFGSSITDWENIDKNLIRVNLNWMQRKGVLLWGTIMGVCAPFENEDNNVTEINSSPD